MPVRTIFNEDHAVSPCTFAFTGTWGTTSASALWGTTPTTPASSGTTRFSSVAGDHCDITLAAHHGYTGGAIIGHGAATNNPNAAITVDGVAVQEAWNQKFGTVNNAAYWMPRILSYPFPLHDSAATQAIRATVGNGGGNLVIDGIELYTAASQVTGRVTRIGHSMEYPVIDGSTLGPNTSGHGQLFVAYLNATKYLGVSSWTDDNQAVPSEDLSNGGANSGLAGGLNTSVLYTQFANQAFYANGAIPTPGWMRLEAGDLWPATHAPRLDSLSLMTTDAQYMVGVPQWWARAFQYGVFFHNFNDPGYTTLYDNPADGVAGNGAAATKRVQALHMSASASSGQFQIVQGANTTAVTSYLTDVATVNARLAAATPSPILFTATGALGSPLTTPTDITLTANAYGAQAALTLTANTVGGGTLTIPTSVTGQDKIAAGAGYGLARFIQRFREALIRVALAITPCPRVAIIGMPNFVNGAAMALSVYQQYDAAMRAVLDEPWIAAMTGGAPFYFVSPMAAMTGFPSNVSGADPHPSTAGHQAIFDELRRAHERNQATATVPTSPYLGA